MVDALSGKVDVLIDGGVVISMDDQRRIFNPGYVAVDKGKIVAVGPSSQGSQEGRERLDASDMVVMPGIVNAHDHLDQSVYRSLLDHKRVSRDNLLNLARGLTRERGARRRCFEPAGTASVRRHDDAGEPLDPLPPGFHGRDLRGDPTVGDAGRCLPGNQR